MLNFNILNNFFIFVSDKISTKMSYFGALTNNLSRFTERKWVYKEVNTLNFLEFVAGRIKLLIKGNQVIKVVPLFNFLLNEDFISNNIRLYFLNYNNQRIVNPLYFFKEKYINVSWKFVAIKFKFDLAFLYLCSLKFKWSFFFLGLTDSLQGRESFFFFKYFVNKLGFSNINLENYRNKLNFLIDFRQNLILKYSKKLSYDLLVFIGLNIRKESPIFNLFILNSSVKYIYNFFCNNEFKNKTIINMGNSFINLIKFIKGNKINSMEFMQFESPCFFFCFNFLNNIKNYNFYFFFFRFFYLNFCNLFFPNIGFMNALDLGLFNRVNTLEVNNKYLFNKKLFYLFFNLKKFNLNYIMFSSFYKKKDFANFQLKYNFKNINLLMPIKNIFEISGIFFDCLGHSIIQNRSDYIFKNNGLYVSNVLFFILNFIGKEIKNKFINRFFGFFSSVSIFYLKKYYYINVCKIFLNEISNIIIKDNIPNISNNAT